MPSSQKLPEIQVEYLTGTPRVGLSELHLFILSPNLFQTQLVKELPTFWANSLEIPSQISYRDPKGWVSEASSKSKSQTFSACEYHVKIIYCVPI